MAKHKYNYNCSQNKACYIVFLSINEHGVRTEQVQIASVTEDVSSVNSSRLN